MRVLIRNAKFAGNRITLKLKVFEGAVADVYSFNLKAN